MSQPSIPTASPFSDETVAIMRQTGTWTRVVSIFLFLGLAITFLGGISLAVIGATEVRHSDAPPFIMLGVGYTVSTFFYIMPAIFLSQYASRAKAFARGGDAGGLAIALRAQKSFWKYIAILMLIMTAINLIAVPVIAVMVFVANR